MTTEKATFGAGCFWGVESAYRQIRGVKSTAVGYAGGHTTDPDYKAVCTGSTGHAEVVEVTYNPDEVSYERLLKVFLDNHNPTQLNRQGPDIGTQYRSVIFYHTDAQKEAAEQALKVEQGKYDRPVVTLLEPAQAFYKAEEYHQQYLEKRGLSSCRI